VTAFPISKFERTEKFPEKNLYVPHPFCKDRLIYEYTYVANQQMNIDEIFFILH
jgi:hypothetical protein